MNSRSTWTLMMIALGMFAFIFFFERHRQTVGAPPGPLLPGLSLTAVTGVQVRPGDKDYLLVERTNGVWQLTHPVVYPVELQRVRMLLQALNSLSRQRSITSEQLRTHKNFLQEYGFDAPQFSVLIKQNDLDQSLFIGHATRTGEEVFVQVVGSTDIFLVDAALLRLLPRTRDDWRERTLVTLNEKAIDRLTVTNNGGRVMEFRREATNAVWRMLQPLPTRADSPRIDKLIQELLASRITQFVDVDPGSDLSAYGLRPAIFDVGLAEGTNAAVVLAFGSSPTNDSGQIYVRRRDLAGVSLVPKESVESWTYPWETFRDHQLLSLAESAVDRVELKGIEGFTLARQSNDVWEITAPTSVAADPDYVRLFFGLLNELRIKQYFDAVNTNALADYGLAPPARTFVFSKSDTNAPDGRRTVAQLEFGSVAKDDREQVYVRRGDEASIYTIARAQDDFVQKGGQWWWFRNRNIWDFTTNDVAKITVRHAGKVMEVFHEPTGGWTLGPGTTGATTHFKKLGVDYTVDSLGRLKVPDFWLDHGPEAPLRYGITDKSFSIEVELRGEPPGRKLKLDLQRSQVSVSPFASTVIEGEVYIFAFPELTFIQIRDCLDPAPNSP